MISFLILSGRSFYFHATAAPSSTRQAPTPTPSATLTPPAPTKPSTPPTPPTPTPPAAPKKLSTPSVHQTGICHRHRHTPPRHRRRAEKQHRNEVK